MKDRHTHTHIDLNGMNLKGSEDAHMCAVSICAKGAVGRGADEGHVVGCIWQKVGCIMKQTFAEFWVDKVILFTYAGI